MTRIRSSNSPVPQGTGRKLNVHEVFCRHPGYLLNVLRTLKLRPMSKRRVLHKVSLFGVIFVRIFPHSDQMRENADQNKAEYGQFLRSDCEVKI